ncbi:MAG: bifunctional 3-(3-hydroxy-phenyl)propionate/3-hydroxycinnamic acid hydroxylase [Pseudomonadota bacterium]
MVDQQIYDVAIVGYGPVGQSLSILLGQMGYKVAAFDRWPSLYPLPRAVFYDHEIRRVFGAMGIEDEVAAISYPAKLYQWFNADWKMLVEMDWSLESVSGGPGGHLFNQPMLEAVLDRKARSLPGVRVEQGWEATALRQLAGHCELTLRHGALSNGAWQATGDTQTVQARYVVGADGANSFVRQALGIEFEDLGFEEEWLVVDVRPNEGVVLNIPDIAQWCNPARPTTLVPGGPGLRRWEFMRLPGESAQDLQNTDKVWELLSPWVTPADATLVRHAVYQFRSRIARSWRDGRVMLAGDAAHQMPPFMGQGMCSGIRDARNLAWRLEMVLDGVAPQRLLDGYTQERRPQIRAVIDASIAMGRVACVSDPEQAAQRDQAFLSGQVPPLPPFPGLSTGVIADGDLAGQLGVHGLVRSGDRTVRCDELVPQGFQVIALDADPMAYLDERSRSILSGIGGTAFGVSAGEVSPPAANMFFDATGKYRAFFAQHGVAAIVVRPDFYVYGAVRTLAELPQMLDRLAQQLGLDADVGVSGMPADDGLAKAGS